MDKQLTTFKFGAMPNIQEMLPLYRAIETKVRIKKSDFHYISGSYMPGRDVLDKIADAAGISFIKAETWTEDGEPYYGCTKYIFVGSAQGEVTEPDGRKRKSSDETYEFNVQVRAEEEFLKGGTKYDIEAKKKGYVLNMIKTGRQRASTGARVRVIRSLLGMKTAFKDLFNVTDVPDKEIEFTFIKIVANPENEMVMKAGLDNMFGNTKRLYGSTDESRPVGRIEHQGDVKVDFTVTDDSEPVDDFSDEIKPNVKVPADERSKIINRLKEKASKISQNGQAAIQTAIDDNSTLEVLFNLEKRVDTQILKNELYQYANDHRLLDQTRKEILTLSQDKNTTLETFQALKVKIEKELNFIPGGKK